MKRVLMLAAIILSVSVLLTACGAHQEPGSAPKIESGSLSSSAGLEQNTENPGTEKRVAKDTAQMQTDDPAMPTRVIENGTRINLHFGDTVLPGILNDCDTAKALIEMLPYTVHMNSYSHDFCGVMPDELPYNEDEVHYGWLNGDIDYAINAPYFTILHSDEDNSEQYDYQVNIGVLDCELSRIRNLSGSYDVLIELAE